MQIISRRMKQECFISVYLDTRRAKENGRFPVKLRVYTSNPRKQKLFPTVFEMTEREFASVWSTSKPRAEFKELRKQLQAVELKANQVAEKLNPFSFEQFERHLYRKAGDAVNINYQYTQVISDLERRKQIGTASSYELSEKSLKDFVENGLKRKYEKLTFFDITPNWLTDYETYMTESKGRSITTVGIYLRALRALFNKAIDAQELEKQYYPFGKRKYQVPATRNVKKALNREQLGKLFHAQPETPEQEKAKDFWFFSYVCNGMNVKDIAQLRYKDIDRETLKFYRAKTRLTSKTNLKPITVHLNTFAQNVIAKYGNDQKRPDKHVFDVLKDGLTPHQEKAKIQNFTRFINQHIKKLCKANELPDEVSTYWARHSFATNVIRNGGSVELVQESLGHGDMKTTQNYFAGFDADTKRELAESLMNF